MSDDKSDRERLIVASMKELELIFPDCAVVLLVAEFEGPGMRDGAD